MIWIIRTLAVVLVAAVSMTASAQTPKRVEVQKAWSVFEASTDGSKVCWIVSTPTKWNATRGGKDVQVNRGDIFLMVSVRPKDKVKNEVSFLAGYPFKGGSNVDVSVGSRNYTMFTDGENAWTRSSKDDDGLTSAFRRGATATIKGTSARGTTTRDEFSLSGFTAAIKSATARCK
ncbi:MAG: invasion associated locus B family protein [Pseudomonadota bacterium]